MYFFNVIDVFLIEVTLFSLSFDEDRSNSEEMATMFRNSWCFHEVWLLRIFDDTDVFWNKVAIIQLNLAMIGQIINK